MEEDIQNSDNLLSPHNLFESLISYEAFEDFLLTVSIFIGVFFASNVGVLYAVPNALFCFLLFRHRRYRDRLESRMIDGSLKDLIYEWAKGEEN